VALAEWKLVPMADTAAQTTNPIRAIVEGIKKPEGSSKEHIPLSIGDPTVFGNFKTPQIFVDKIVKALQAFSCNGYLHSAGTVACRAAIAKRYSTEASPLTADDVVIASGCSGALDMCITVLCNPGTNLIVPKPGFPLYETLAASKGVDVRYYSLLADRSWEADLAELEAQIDEKTSAILVNNPSNPCGSVFSKEHLEDIVALAERYKVPIIADEIYGNLVFEGSAFFPLGSLSPTVPVLSTGGIAKEFLVPG
jgi:tyrosine aminotransferase